MVVKITVYLLLTNLIMEKNSFLETVVKKEVVKFLKIMIYQIFINTNLNVCLVISLWKNQKPTVELLAFLEF